MHRFFCDKLGFFSPFQTSNVSAERRCRHARTATFLALVAVNSTAFAASNEWGLCGGGLVLPERPAVDIEREPGDPEGMVQLSADRAELDEAGESTLVDNVQVVRGGEQMSADRVTYDNSAEIINAAGGVRLWSPGVYAAGSSARMDLVNDISSLDNAEFLMRDEHARGSASQIELEAQNIVRIKNAGYTTCNPGDASWLLEAEYIRLDREQEIGYARDVWLMFHDTPVFYTPVMTFPLGDKRKSGFLTPSFGITGSTGVETTVPYYFNIAPDKDATLAARMMTDRGVLLEGEFRYLTPNSRGLLGGEFIANDSERDEARGAVHFDHVGSFSPRWQTDVNVNWVSDREYFEDLGTDLAISSQSFLERRGDLRYLGDGWTVLGRLQNFQTVDPTVASEDRPYERLPQLKFNTNRRNVNREFNLNVDAEFVHFDRRSSVTGQRIDLVPSVSYPIRTASSFFVPRVALHQTTYSLDDTAAGDDDSPSRTLPSFSADAGMFFERDTKIFDRAYVQTLEPRAYYLLTPYKNQDDLPVFDTGEYTFNFSQLFRNDRFNGADRISDANQLTLALTSRLLDAYTGDEVMRASIGQIRYFRDRRVGLPGEAVQSDDSSDLVGDFAVNINDIWRFGAGLQWDLNDNTTNKSTLAVRWQPDRRRIINASYRFVRDAVEQTDVSFRWPMGVKWSAVGRWNYAPDDERTLEVFGGFEYESCCWALRAVGRRYLNNTNGGYNNGVFLQLELRGLAGLATGNSDFLERSIPGYRPGY